MDERTDGKEERRLAKGSTRGSTAHVGTQSNRVVSSKMYDTHCLMLLCLPFIFDWQHIKGFNIINFKICNRSSIS